MTRQLPVRTGYEYPARPRKHQVPCPHRQGVGYGAFCISGTCTPLERCNTLDFVPKLCTKVAAPLGIPAHIACWRCEFAAQKALTKAHRAVYGEGKALLRKCNNLLSSLRPAKCNGLRLYRVRFRQIATYVCAKGCTHMRSNFTKFLLYRDVFLDDSMIYSSRLTVA